MKRVYLDYAAAAPVTPVARRAFLEALSAYGNPASAHEEGRRAKAVLEDARTSIARLAGAKASEVVFVSGATEGNALAILGHARAANAASILYHPGAHASVAKAAAALCSQGVDARPLALEDGAPALATLKEASATLVSLEAVSPETGRRFDTRAVRHALPDGAILHVDASQLPLVESFERTRLGADLMTLDAQKVGGVRGIGALIRSSRVPLAPLYEGGGQEGGYRSGTPAPALAAAFAAALEETARTRAAFSERAARMRAALIARVERDVPSVLINGESKTAPHIVSFSFLGLDTDYLQALLDKEGFAVGTKSACETDSADGARSVFADSSDARRAASTLRVSWGRETKESELRAFSGALVRAIRFLEANTLY